MPPGPRSRASSRTSRRSPSPDGTFYAGSYVGGLYVIDVTTGTGTLVDDTVGCFETGATDDAGTLWFITDGVECNVGLSSLSLSDPTVVTCESTYAPLATGAAPAPAPAPKAPQLAATGAAPGLAVAPLAGLTLLIGIATLILARRRAA